MVGRYDFRGLETWSLAPHAPVLCFGHDFVQKNSSVGAWLEKNLQEKALVAILNWVGASQPASGMYDFSFNVVTCSYRFKEHPLNHGPRFDPLLPVNPCVFAPPSRMRAGPSPAWRVISGRI